ncbi:hypothetical protein BDD12DRAFT_821949 [Trichophaea hybrida]|nr:hypothetical protein BDD12DRAFT_821949 [Trichophaea hybrida]
MLTAEDILRFQPTPPPRAFNHQRGTTGSDSHMDFSPIPYDRLVAIDSQVVARFRDYIRSLSPHVDFSCVSPLLPYDAEPLPDTHIRTEADIRCFVHTSLLLPTWPVMLSMLPSNRLYGWTFEHENPGTTRPEVPMPPTAVAGHATDLRQMPKAPVIQGKARKSSADIAVLQYTNTGVNQDDWAVTTAFVLELKGPCRVYDARNHLKSSVFCADEWAKLTRQIRKYAVHKKCPHHVLMDERFAIYFYFDTENFADESAEVYYLTAEFPIPDDPGTPQSDPFISDESAKGISQDNVGKKSDVEIFLTVRELLVFAAWSAVPARVRPMGPLYQHRVYSSSTLAVPFIDCYTSVGPKGHPATPPRPQGREARLNARAQKKVSLTLLAVHTLQMYPGDYPIGTNRPSDRRRKTFWLTDRYDCKGSPYSDSTYASGHCATSTMTPYLPASITELGQENSIIFSSSDTQLDDHTSPNDILLDPFWSVCTAEDNPEDIDLHISNTPILPKLALENLTRLQKGVYYAARATAPKTESLSVIIKKFCNNERHFLERELQAYAALRHLQGRGIPQVIGLYRSAECDDPDIDDTSPYLLVLTYIALFPLSQLPDPELDETFLDKCTIDALHGILDQILDAGVLHNDLQNSENLLVDMHQPDRVLVSIVDFGQATVVEAVEEVQRERQRAYLDSAWEAYLDRCWNVRPDTEG